MQDRYLKTQLDENLSERRIDIHEANEGHVKRLRARDEAQGIETPNEQELCERVKEHDPQLAAEIDEAIGWIKAAYGIAGYMTGWAAYANASEEADRPTP